ncbi:MAG: carboxypeptidase-like regulatory domain-containing protein [Flavobacteriales bacterium]|nr:carboxypeptidase-like regulatory domain-containing protein [Flavobacteriales bacterium]
MKQNIVLPSLLLMLIIIMSGCVVQKATSKGRCDGYKVLRNETTGTLSDEASQGMIYGVTLESQGVIVPYMDVVVLDSTGKQVTGITSGSFGEYKIQLEPGTYQVKFNRVGYCMITLKDIIVSKGEIRELIVIVPEQTTH